MEISFWSDLIKIIWKKNLEKILNILNIFTSFNFKKSIKSLSGDNAGEITVDNGKLSMFNPSGQMFSAQMSNITQVSSTKNEVSLQFKRGEGISCTAMKFHVLSAQDADTFKAEVILIASNWKLFNEKCARHKFLSILTKLLLKKLQITKKIVTGPK